MKPAREYVRPRTGFVVCKPRSEGGGHLPEAGELVPLTSYWRRRIKTGEVIAGKPTAAPHAQPEKKAKE